MGTRRVFERMRWPLAAVAALMIAPAATASAATPDRYSLANGCYSLTSAAQPVAGAESVRMQATALGRYLLYRPDRSFLSAQGGRVAPAAEPSEAADWRVEE